MNLDDLPDTIDLEIEITVGGDVPKPIDRSPSNLGMSLLDLGRKPIRRFSKRLQSPENSVLDVDIAKERFASNLSPLLDQINRLANVGQEPAVTLAGHSVTASRRICSACG